MGCVLSQGKGENETAYAKYPDKLGGYTLKDPDDQGTIPRNGLVERRTTARECSWLLQSPCVYKLLSIIAYIWMCEGL